MKLRLEVSTSPDKKRTFEHSGSSLSVGRDSGCELVFPDTDVVSSKHARIDLTPDGAYLRDLESTNGTFLNDRRVEKRTAVKEGDYIRLGQAGPYLKLVCLDLSGGVERDRTEKRSPSPPSPLPRRSPAAPRATIATRVRLAIMESRFRLIWIWTGVGVVAIAMIFGITLLVYHFQLGYLERQTGELKGAVTTAQHSAAEAMQSTQDLVAKIPADSKDVYTRVVRTNACILGDDARGVTWQGTGSLINRERRLVLTAHHVIDNMNNLRLYFPSFAPNGEPIADKQFYRSSMSPIACKVIASNPLADLAVLQVSSIPTGIEVLPIATESPKPATRLHTVGNPVRSGAYWVYSAGAVRQVVKDKIFMKYRCCMIEFQNPINGGDSGGPVVNDRAELVGVNSTSYVSVDIFLVSNAIDVSEVRKLLAAVPN